MKEKSQFSKKQIIEKLPGVEAGTSIKAVLHGAQHHYGRPPRVEEKIRGDRNQRGQETQGFS